MKEKTLESLDVLVNEAQDFRQFTGDYFRYLSEVLEGLDKVVSG